MKQDWEIKKLKEVLKIQNGYAFDAKLFTIEEGTPLIRIRDIKVGVKTVTNFKGKYDKKYEVNAGDFLIGMDGDFGCYEWKGDTALLNQRVCRLQEFSSKLYPRFLFYGINKYLKAIEEVTAFATVKHISSKQIENIEIPLPPFPEQQRIVAILDDAFTKIGKAKANTEQNLKNAKELFESYLQGVFESKGDDWEEKTLKELTSHLGDGLHGTPKYTLEGDYYFINGNNLSDGVIEFKSSTKRVSYEEYNKHKKNLTDRTILVSINGTLGNVAFYNNEKIILGKSACYFNMKEGTDKNYIKYVLSSPYFLKYAHKEATGATIKNVSLKTMREFIVPLPSLTQQQVIVQKLDALSDETKKLEAIYQQKTKDLEELKKSVLQKAFSGELK